jgi:hypothetical protein
MSAHYREAQTLFFIVRKSLFVSMAISGMAGGSRIGNTSCHHSGERSFEPIANGTNATFESFACSAGMLFEYGSTNSPETKKTAFNAFFVRGDTIIK